MKTLSRPYMRFKQYLFSALALPAACLLSLPGAPVHAQTFYSQPTVVPTSTWPQNVQAAAFVTGKAPGFAYLGYAPASQSSAPFSLLLNNGAGAFTASAFSNVAFNNSSPAYALGDTRGKGTVDVVYFATPTTVLTALGDGNGGVSATVSSAALSSVGTLTPTWTYASLARLTTSSTVPTLFAEDTANQTLSVIRNDSASFTTVLSTISLATDGVGNFIVADLNGDGNVDILVLNEKSHIATPYYGRGDGTFRPSYAFTLPNGVFSMQLQDIDGDGRPELFLSDSNGALFYFQNTSAYGLLSTPIAVGGAANGLTGNGGHLLAAGDLNGDGIPDLITATPAGISVLLGTPSVANHSGAFSVTLKGIYNGGPGRTSAMLADFNGDGKLDLALDSPEGIAILYGIGDGSFSTSKAFAAGQPALDLALGQFANSGHLDAVVATGVPQVQVLNGDGAGNFVARLAPSPAGAAETNARRTLLPHLYTGDFDGDGQLDVAITLDGQPPVPAPTASGSADGTTIQFGNGDGTFSAPVSAEPMANSSHYGHSAVGDFNGDGISDIANFDTYFYATYLGGSGARSGSMPQSVFYADTSNDSINVDEDAYDLVTTGFLNPGSTKNDILMQDDGEFFIYQNNGDDTFSPAANDMTPTLLAPTGYVSVNANTSHFPSTGIFPTALKLVDLDQDGYGDAMMLYHNLASDPAHPDASTPNTLYIYWGEGNRSFSTPTVLTLSRNYYELAIADIDGDGRPDLVLSDGNLVAVLYNQGNRVFGNEQHFLAGQGINLISPGDVNHDGAQDLVLANGGPVLSNPVVTNGALPYTAELNTGGITVLLNTVRPHAVTGSLSASPEPSLYGQAFTITAVVTQPSGAIGPTGTVTFSVDGAVVGSGSVTNNQASYTVSAPTYIKGQHALSATYSGDGVYSPIAFTGTHAVDGLPSVTTVTNLVTPIYYGQEIGYTNGIDAVVSVAAATTPIPPGATLAGGEIDVTIDGQLVCTLVQGATGPTGGPQRCPDSNFQGFPAGPHQLVAQYLGNDYFDASTSPTYTVLVLPDDTSNTITTSLTPAPYGTAVTFTATLTAQYATPTGNVTFLDGTTTIGSGTLNAQGVATFTTSTLAVGTHTITASYAATTNFNASQSSLTQVIVATSGTVLTSSLNPSTFGQSVTFTAAVALAGTTATATGTITFTDAATTLQTATLNAQGVATYTNSTLTIGQHPITATFTPAANSNALGSSASLTQVVTTPATLPPGNDFTLTVDPTSFSAGIGNSATINVTVTPGSNFTEPVALNCSGLPWEATCTFVTGTIPSGGGATQLAVHPEAPHNCSDSDQYFMAGTDGWLACALGIVVALFCGFRRRRLGPVLFGLVLCLLPMLGGCGSGRCTDLGTRPGSYTFTITGNAVGSLAVSHSQTVTMKAYLDGEPH